MMKRTDIYLVGYSEGVVYGREHILDCNRWETPVGIITAKELLKKMVSKGAVLYKIVPVKASNKKP